MQERGTCNLLRHNELTDNIAEMLEEVTSYATIEPA